MKKVILARKLSQGGVVQFDPSIDLKPNGWRVVDGQRYAEAVDGRVVDLGSDKTPPFWERLKELR